jgi:hypothetical protein
MGGIMSTSPIITYEQDFNTFYEFVNRMYQKRYKVTLAFNSENLLKAMKVYSVGINEGLGITQAVKQVYGYRYRRMENFLRELGLWTNGESWNINQSVIKIDITVESGQGRRITFFRFVIELVLYSFPLSEGNADEIAKQIAEMYDLFKNAYEIETGYELRFDPKNLAELRAVKQFGKLFTDQYANNRFIAHEEKNVEVVTTC